MYDRRGKTPRTRRFMHTCGRCRGLDLRCAATGLVVLGALLVSAGCATYSPRSLDELSILDRVLVKQKGDLTVKVVVASPDESKKLFGFNLAANGVQPIWVEITNRGDHSYLFMQRNVDPDYFSPYEVAWMGRGVYTAGASRKMERYLHDTKLPLLVPQERSARVTSSPTSTLACAMSWSN